MWALWIVLLIGTVIVVGVAFDARTTLFNRRLQRVARTTGGTFVKGGPFHPPTVRFSVGRVPALIAFWTGPHRPEPIGMFQARWGGAEVVEIEHKLWGNRVGGPPRVTVDDSEFEDRFRVRASGSAALVDAALRRALVRLSVMGPVSVSFRPRLVEINVRAEEWDEFTMRQFMELSISAVRPALGPAAEETGAIEWVEDDAPEALHCPMCAAPLSTGVVRCRRCRAPHHADCWEYAGRCSAFACGCTRFTTEGGS